MTPCSHQTLVFVGEQKTEDGVNGYYKCSACGDLLVVTPASKVLAVKGVAQNPSSAPAPRKTKS